MNNLFAYGTIQHKSVQLSLLGVLLEAQRTDALPDHKLAKVFADDDYYPAALPEQGSSIPGTVYQVSDEQLAILDDYEGSSYVRRSFQLASGYIALVYVPSSLNA